MRRKENEIWLIPLTKAPIATENSTTNWQNKTPSKQFDYTTIVDRLRTVNNKPKDIYMTVVEMFNVSTCLNLRTMQSQKSICCRIDVMISPINILFVRMTWSVVNWKVHWFRYFLCCKYLQLLYPERIFVFRIMSLQLNFSCFNYYEGHFLCLYSKTNCVSSICHRLTTFIIFMNEKGTKHFDTATKHLNLFLCKDMDIFVFILHWS